MTEGRRVIYHFSISLDGQRAALCHADPTTPNDVYSLELGVGGQERRLTDVNHSFRTAGQLSEPERYTFLFEEVTVEGWILRPSGTRGEIRTPAVLQSHGGPMVMYGYLFFFESQLLVANGITVVYSNPRGSMGYGQ